MAKQQKVLNKINNSINNGHSVGVMKEVRKNPNDECYTSMQDILDELTYWADKGKFQGKNIICPCDWDIVDGQDIFSITIKFNEKSINVTGNSVESITFDLFTETEVKKVNAKEEELDSFLKEKLTCNFLRTLTQRARQWGIKSITASGYDPVTGRGTKFQDVDYSQYDICITNPPFSLYGEFMKCIVGKIDFIVLAPFTNRVTPNIGLPLMLKQAYLGKGVHISMNFNNPTAENKFNTKQVGCDWITSFPEAQADRNALNYKSGIKYEDYKDEYVEMTGMTMKDGTHPIRVPGAFPEDYDGWMFGAINILDKLNQDEYEWYGTNFKGFLNSSNINPFNHKASNEMVSDATGKKYFHGVVFRRKPRN